MQVITYFQCEEINTKIIERLQISQEPEKCELSGARLTQNLRGKFKAGWAEVGEEWGVCTFVLILFRRTIHAILSSAKFLPAVNSQAPNLAI